MRRTRALLRPLWLGALFWLAACGHAKDGPTPQKGEGASLDPQAVCLEQLTTEVTVRGGAMSPLPTKVLDDEPELALPQIDLLRTQDLEGAASAGEAVTIPDDPANPQESQVRWKSQREMTFAVDPALSLAPGLYSVRVTNRNGHEGLWPEALLAVPRPKAEAITPDILCSPQGGTAVISGEGFIHVGDRLPTVTATPKGGGDAVQLAVQLADCRALPGSAGLETCNTIQVTVGKDQLPAGEIFTTYEIRVENPAPVGCHSTEPLTLTMVPAPELDLVEPEIICTAQKDNTITLTGKGFLQLGEMGPTVIVAGRAYPATVSECTEIPDPKQAVESCTKATITVPQADIADGVHPVVVQNPAPADCVSSERVNLAVVPPPKITAVDPGVVCDVSDESTVVIRGSGFLTIGDGSGARLPEVRINGETFVPVASDCRAITGLVATVETCATLTVKVPKGTLAIGEHDVSVTNPPPADCSSDATFKLEVVEPPTVTAVVPTKLCEGGGTLAVSGSGFHPGITVSLAGTAASVVTVTSNDQLSATFGALPFPAGSGPYDLTVSYSAECAATKTAAVTIVPGPQLFFADPPVVYNGIETQITLYGSGFSGAPTFLGIRAAGSSDAPTSLTYVYDPAKPNRLQAVVPQGTAAGDYDVILHDQTSCDAVLAGGLKVVDQVTLKLTAVVPPFGHTGATTGVTVFADPAVGGGFAPGPRLYLNPTTASQASPVEAVAFVDAGRVTALVPEGLAVDKYDLIAVNPDGGVGLLAGGFEVTALPPPVPEVITPGSIADDSAAAVKVSGHDFRSPTATIRCRDKNTGAETEQTVTVASSTATEVNLTVDATAFNNGAVCIVRITNDDGTYGELPGLVITNPAQNLSTFNKGPDLATARRALAAVAARATSAARFVYAIGGDDGSPQGALDTVEVATVDIFGAPAAFFTQQNRLQQPRSLTTAAVVGRCVYLAGGASAGAVLGSVERACVLDPAERPRIVDLDLLASTSAGLDQGLWYYQVAAVMPAAHPSNPGGETLPSEPFPVLLPALSGRKVVVTVHWSQVPGAAGYRVYRSPAAGAAINELQLLATIDSGATTSHEDSGGAAQGKGPLRLGATSVWHKVAELATARQGAGVAVAPDPGDSSGSQHHLYVMGGHDGSQALDSGERLAITIQADGSQTVGAPVAAGQPLSQARWQLGLFSVGNDNASFVTPPTHYLYAGGGVAANGTTMENAMEAYEIQPGGALGAPLSVSMMQPARAGYGYAPANNFLYVFGGNKAKPDTTVTSVKLCDAAGTNCAGDPPPTLDNWNNASAKMIEGRYLMGSALQSGFFYILGGQTTLAAASATTEYSNW